MEEKDLQLLEESKLYVSSMGKWMKFMAILGCIGIAFIVLIAFAVLFSGTLLADAFGGLGMRWLGLVYLVFVALYIPPVIYLFRASSAAQLAVEANNNEQVVEFLKNNKSFWKFCGILTIVVLCIYVVAIIGIIIAAIAMRMSMM